MGKSQGRGLALAQKHIVSGLSQLRSIRESLEFLSFNARGSFQDNESERTTASGCRPIGFDSSLNRRLSAPAPPRAIRILSWIEVSMIKLLINTSLYPWFLKYSHLNQTLDYFEKLLRDLDIVCSFSMDPSVEGILQFIVRFQKSKPDLVARAYLQVKIIFWR